MALDLYVKEDILNVLRALHVASEVPTALAVDLLHAPPSAIEVQGDRLPRDREQIAQDQLVAYQQGYRTALASVALAFGLVPVTTADPAASSPETTSRQTTSRGTPGSGPRYEVDLRSFVESMVRSRP